MPHNRKKGCFLFPSTRTHLRLLLMLCWIHYSVVKNLPKVSHSAKYTTVSIWYIVVVLVSIFRLPLLWPRKKSFHSVLVGTFSPPFSPCQRDFVSTCMTFPKRFLFLCKVGCKVCAYIALLPCPKKHDF